MKTFLFLSALSLLLCVRNDAFSQRKVLVKQQGVSLSYEVETLGTCSAKVPVRLGQPPRRDPNKVKMYKYTVYLTNDNSKAVKFTQGLGNVISVMVNNYVNLETRGEDCQRLFSTLQNLVPRGNILQANSELMGESLVTMFANLTTPPKPSYTMAGFTLLNQ